MVLGLVLQGAAAAAAGWVPPVDASGPGLVERVWVSTSARSPLVERTGARLVPTSLPGWVRVDGPRAEALARLEGQPEVEALGSEVMGLPPDLRLDPEGVAASPGSATSGAGQTVALITGSAGGLPSRAGVAVDPYGAQLGDWTRLILEGDAACPGLLPAAQLVFYPEWTASGAPSRAEALARACAELGPGDLAVVLTQSVGAEGPVSAAREAPVAAAAALCSAAGAQVVFAEGDERLGACGARPALRGAAVAALARGARAIGQPADAPRWTRPHWQAPPQFYPLVGAAVLVGWMVSALTVGLGLSLVAAGLRSPRRRKRPGKARVRR